MSSYPLKIVTPDGLIFDGLCSELIVRTTSGDMGILTGHTDCVAPLGMGRAVVVDENGTRRNAACIGGMLLVLNGQVRLVPTTFEWADEIDVERARRALDKAKQSIDSQKLSSLELRMAEAHLRRALVRVSVAQNNP